MADQAITALPKKTYSGSSQIASTDYLLGIDSAEGYQMLIQDLGEYIINRATASLAGSTQTLASAISALNSKSNTYIGTATGSNRQEFVQNLVTLINNKFPLANLANGTVLTGSATWSGQGYCGYVVTRNSGGANITVQIGGEIVSALIDTRNLAISAFTDLNSNFTVTTDALTKVKADLTIGSQNRVYKYGRIVFVTVVFSTTSDAVQNEVLFTTPYSIRFPVIAIVRNDEGNTYLIGTDIENSFNIKALYGSGLPAGVYRGTFTYLSAL